MKKKLAVLFALVLLILSGCSSVSNVTVLATVQDIQPCAQNEPSLDNWLVSTKVDQVVKGKFDSKKLDFLVHSPSRSGLEKGKKYEIDLKIKDDKVTVENERFYEK